MNLNNPIYLIVSYIFIFTFPGLFILNYFDPNNEFFFYAFGSLTDFNVNNFYSNIFFGLIPILLFLVIFFRIPAQSFKNQDIDLTNARFIYFNFIAALILINLYFFISFNYSIPIVSIAGLVTTWGGANSHMAIRAGELGIPAVIGAGEILYEKWSKADIINLDCGKQLVEVLR